MSRVAILPMLALALASPAHAAGDAAGTAAASFLAIGSGTSVQSMGGATLASGNDLASAAWNVASLARVAALQFSLAHAPLPGGATQDWLAGGGKLGGAGTRWGLQGLFQREGDLDGRDAADNPTGSLSVNDLALGASLAQPLGAYVTAGAGAEWVHESLAGTNGSGVSFSAGLRADAGPLGFGLAARHLGGEMRYPGARYDLPQVIAAGMSWTDAARGLRVNADYESPRHYYDSVRLGGEWRWRDRVAFRAGYRLAMSAPSDATVSGPAFGIGAGVGSMWLDYAFLLDGGDTSGEHRVGLTFRPAFHYPAARAGARLLGTAGERSPGPANAPAAGSSTSFARPAPPAPAAPPAASAPQWNDAEARAAAPKSSARPAAVVVAEGETLRAIAKRWGTDVDTLMMLNNLVSERVSAGQRIRLPAAKP